MNVLLSKLVAGRVNPRRVRTSAEEDRKLRASIRAHGLIEPLVVRPENGHFQVIAGKRRLAALRAVYGDKDVAVPCEVRKVDAEQAEELSLAENYARSGMHPLDEAECFARMASVDRKGVSAIAAEFGVKESYVRQRMKLAGLCSVVKKAYRADEIDTATAEAFAAVPPGRQEEVWKEIGGKPRNAQHVRSLIEHRWIDAKHSLFDVDSLPPIAVSTDLFRECVLVERDAFMQAQALALAAERERLVEDGWSAVTIGERSDIHSMIYSMAEPEPEFTKAERTRLDRLARKRERLDADTGEDEQEPSRDIEVLNEEAEAIVRKAQGRYSEETKCRGTVFLMLSPDGQVERHYRVARLGSEHRTGHNPTGLDPEGPLPPPTANDLSARQQAEWFMHEAIAVRDAVAANAVVRKRLLILALHDKVRTDALAVRRDANTTTIHAENIGSFKSGTFDALRSRRDAIDPFKGEHSIEEADGYQRLCGIPEEALDRLIDSLIADCLTGHGQRETPLLTTLAQELEVSIRRHWTPDAEWLSGYQKIQLADLMGTLRGPAHGSAALKRKKSELVEELAGLFCQAANAEGGLEDQSLAARVNGWVPTLKE